MKQRPLKNLSLLNVLLLLVGIMSYMCICRALFRVITRFYLSCIIVLRKFQSFIFFYESINLGGGFKGSFFSSHIIVLASMLCYKHVFSCKIHCKFE